MLGYSCQIGVTRISVVAQQELTSLANMVISKGLTQDRVMLF